MSTLKRKKHSLGRIQNKFLTVLSASAEALDVLGNFTYNPYPYLYASLGVSYRKDSIDDVVSDLTKRGLVEGSKEEGLRLTPAGANVTRRLHRARQEEWDGRWRVVIFDIPEAQRDIRDDLRYEVKKLGFGLWQRSVWVSPFNISAELDAYLQRQGLAEVVQILVGERFGGPGDREFAAQIWPLHDINERYNQLLVGWARELKKESSAVERLQTAASFQNRYFGILTDDPQLPFELLPEDWAGGNARELFKKLRSILAKGKPTWE